MNDWVGLTVGEVLKQAGVGFREVTLIDEPPGKLRALQFPLELDGVSGTVTLSFEYGPELFNPERNWPPSLVEAQAVNQVHWDPGDQTQ